MSNPRVLTTVTVLAAVLSLGATVAVQGQTPPSGNAQEKTPAQQQMQIHEEEVKAYAAAATEVRGLNQKWVPRLRAAQMEEGSRAADAVREQALTEMTAAVQARGLSVEKYNQIYELAQVDPDLQQRIQDHMNNVPTGQ